MLATELYSGARIRHDEKEKKKTRKITSANEKPSQDIKALKNADESFDVIIVFIWLINCRIGFCS